MKKLSTLVLIILTPLSFIIFTGCSSEEIPGPQGEEGPEGPQGEKGDPGSVDIYYSEWFDSKFPHTPHKFIYFEIEDENINSDLIDDYVFLAYGKTGSSTITLIPVTIGRTSYYATVFIENKFVRFGASTTDNTSNTFFYFFQYRYIIIPLEKMPTNRAIKLEDLSYEEVCELYNIPK